MKLIKPSDLWVIVLMWTVLAPVAAISAYNRHLYLKGMTARLKKGNIVFETTITGVNEYGQLLTSDAVDQVFNFGEVEWLI